MTAGHYPAPPRPRLIPGSETGCAAFLLLKSVCFFFRVHVEDLLGDLFACCLLHAIFKHATKTTVFHIQVPVTKLECNGLISGVVSFVCVCVQVCVCICVRASLSLSPCASASVCAPCARESGGGVCVPVCLSLTCLRVFAHVGPYVVFSLWVRSWVWRRRRRTRTCLLTSRSVYRRCVWKCIPGGVSDYNTALKGLRAIQDSSSQWQDDLYVTVQAAVCVSTGFGVFSSIICCVSSNNRTLLRIKSY